MAGMLRLDERVHGGQRATKALIKFFRIVAAEAARSIGQHGHRVESIPDPGPERK